MLTNGDILLTIGFILIFLGIAILFISFLFLASRFGSREESRVSGGGIIFLGPIPIVFGTNSRIARVMFLISIIILILFILSLIINV